MKRYFRNNFNIDLNLSPAVYPKNRRVFKKYDFYKSYRGWVGFANFLKRIWSGSYLALFIDKQGEPSTLLEYVTIVLNL